MKTNFWNKNFFDTTYQLQRKKNYKQGLPSNIAYFMNGNIKLMSDLTNKEKKKEKFINKVCQLIFFAYFMNGNT